MLDLLGTTKKTVQQRLPVPDTLIPGEGNDRHSFHVPVWERQGRRTLILKHDVSQYSTIPFGFLPFLNYILREFFRLCDALFCSEERSVARCFAPCSLICIRVPCFGDGALPLRGPEWIFIQERSRKSRSPSDHVRESVLRDGLLKTGDGRRDWNSGKTAGGPDRVDRWERNVWPVRAEKRRRNTEFPEGAESFSCTRS